MPSYSHLHRRFAREDQGFTLVEMLVAVTVLSLIVVMVAQLTSSAALLLRNTRRMDADTEARLVFNHMALDFSAMLKRPDIDYSSFKQPAGTLPSAYGGTAVAANLQVGNDQCAFYAGTDGYFSGTSQPAGTGKAPVALVAYMIANDPVSNTPALRRMGKGLGWEPSSPAGAWLNMAYLPATLSGQWSDLFSGDPDYKTVGDDVFRFEYMYQLKTSPTAASRLSITPYDTTMSGHTSVNGFSDVSAIIVTLAILDNNSRQLVSSYSTLTRTLKDAQNGQSTSATWDSEVESSSFATTAAIPGQAAAQVRVYERYFYLNNLQESSPY